MTSEVYASGNHEVRRNG